MPSHASVIAGTSSASSQPGAMTAGGPICSASTYVPASETRIAARSAPIRRRTRPREKPPRRRAGAGTAGGGTTRSPGWCSAFVSAVAAVSSGRQPLMLDHEVVHVRVTGRLGAVRHAELAVRVGEVELHRLLGHPQLAGDALVGVALRGEAEDLLLALRQRAVLLAHGRARVPEPLDDVALRDLAQHRAHAHRVHALGEHAVGAGLEGLAQPLLVHAHGEKQALGVGRVLGGLAQAGDRVLRQLHVVDDDDVGSQLVERAGGRAAAVDEADHLESGGLPEGETDCVDHERVVRDDHQTLHAATSMGSECCTRGAGRSVAGGRATAWSRRVIPRKSTVGTLAAMWSWSMPGWAVTISATSAPSRACSSSVCRRANDFSSGTKGSWYEISAPRACRRSMIFRAGDSRMSPT